MCMKLPPVVRNKRKKQKKIFWIKEICEKPQRRYTYCGRYTVYIAPTVARRGGGVGRKNKRGGDWAR